MTTNRRATHPRFTHRRPARTAAIHPHVHFEPSATLPTATWSDWSCGVRVVVDDPVVLDAAVASVCALMKRVERAASRFEVESGLCWANANHGRPTVVPALLVDLVAGALDGARRSGGALDPTIGRYLNAIGYDRDILLVTDSHEPVRDVVGTRRDWHDVRLDADRGLLTVPAGTSLDLGATAKAQTADLAARAVYERFGCAVLVEIGGDLAVAGPKADWQVVVAERAGTGPAAGGQQVTVARGGVATSTTTIRTWRRGTRNVHHIIDPRTGQPADGPWRTVSVATESAVLANVCATAAIVLGADAIPWLRTQGVAARLIDQEGNIDYVGGWPVQARPAPPATDHPVRRRPC